MLQTFFVYCVIWQCLFMFAQFAIIDTCFKKPSKKLKDMGRSYICSTLNAISCSACGIYIYLQTQDETVACKYFFVNCVDENLLNFTIITGINLSAHFTLDLIGILYTYPRDKSETNSAIAIHHLIFLLCGVLGSCFYLTPYTYSWLNLCEISTIFLNSRWFAINTGNGSSTMYWVASYLFVLCFIIFRIFIYAIGLFDIYMKYDKIQQSMYTLNLPSIKIKCTVAVLILVFLGWILQLFWFVTGILPLLFRKGGKKKKKHT